jgi:hypothetical protein
MTGLLNRIVLFIHALYGLYLEEGLSPWMSADDAFLRKQRAYFEFILFQLDPDAKETLPALAQLVPGLLLCPTGQSAGLETVAHALMGHTLKPEGFERDFSRAFALWKEEIFTRAILPPERTQNVHVLNAWRQRLGEELGVKTGHIDQGGTMGQDPFSGHRGNALEAFYQKMTPDALVNWYRGWVNESLQRVSGCVGFLMNKGEISGDMRHEEMNVYFILDKELDYDVPRPESLHVPGAKKMLESVLHLLKRKPSPAFLSPLSSPRQKKSTHCEIS